LATPRLAGARRRTRCFPRKPLHFQFERTAKRPPSWAAFPVACDAAQLRVAEARKTASRKASGAWPALRRPIRSYKGYPVDLRRCSIDGLDPRRCPPSTCRPATAFRGSSLPAPGAPSGPQGADQIDFSCLTSTPFEDRGRRPTCPLPSSTICCGRVVIGAPVLTFPDPFGEKLAKKT
jgi:hypothetical protein